MSRIERAPTGIEWRDLTAMSPMATLRELTLPLPWLALSLALYASPYWPLGAFASFMFFLTALRLNHEAIHGNLGLQRRADHAVMHVLSMIMAGSNHADAVCHMAHHRDTMGPDDHEGHCGHMTALQVLLYGPKFPVDLNRAAWRAGSPKWRRRILVDWALIIGFAATILALQPTALLLHLAAMALAQCLTAFFAVWITHQGLADSGLAGRSQRGPLARAAYLMFYHREHHLFPAVPVHRLPDLAQRLDSRVPGYAANRQPIVKLWDSP